MIAAGRSTYAVFPARAAVRHCPSRPARSPTSGARRINDYAAPVKLFSCDNCQQVLFFENSRCMNCGMTVGYCVELAKIVTLQHQTGSSQGSVYEVFFPNQGLRHYRQCKNAQRPRRLQLAGAGREPAAVLQFLPPHGSRARSSATLTTASPGPASKPRNGACSTRCTRSSCRCARARNGRTKASRSISCAAPNDEPVMTGHDEGIITLNIAEADSAFRENMREKMGEALSHRARPPAP